MDKEQIKALALQCGFELKPQPDETMDLHPYVYHFAVRLLARRNAEAADQPRLIDHSANMETCTLAVGDERHYYRKECNNLKWGEEEHD